MPRAARVGDIGWVPADTHGKNCCPHSAQGPAIDGSSDILINGQEALRVGDPGIHFACCGKNQWEVAEGAPGVFFNEIPVARIGDQTRHCGGMGVLISGSANVIIGNYSGAAGQWGSPKVAPSTSWIEIELVDEEDEPVPDVQYRIELVDGSIREGRTSPEGRARITGIDPGTCKVSFPDLDGSAWKAV